MGAIWAGAVPAETGEGPRLEALRRYDILDTPPESEFDEVAALAADLLQAPMALVSLVDADRQWSKARVGVDVPTVPRDWAFCDHALRTGGEPLVVPDAAADPRFADNPLVAGGPRIRFYAGVPLVTPDGQALGTVCVLSPEPRPAGLSPAELRRLSSLAAVAMRVLEVRREALQAARFAAEAEARQVREERLRLALDAAGGCAWELHPLTGLSTWDTAARDLFGVPEVLAFGDALRFFAHPEDARAVEAAVSRALDPAGDGRCAVEHRGARPGADGRPRWFRSVGQAWFGAEGSGGGRARATRLVCTSIEITEQRAAAERQTLLVAELNHRVKNTLAVVLALAEQTHRATAAATGAGAATGPEREWRFHADFQARLLALARAHDLLTRKAWQGTSLAELARAALGPFCAAGADGGGRQPPRIEAEGPPVLLAPEPAVALAMALHELATNASKHGALSRPAGKVSLAWRPAPPAARGKAAALEIAWTESGGPPLAGPPVRRGFGLRLLERALARQLGGEVALDYPGVGFAFRLRLPFDGNRVALG
jgi:two-component sensor histidine kinase